MTLDAELPKRYQMTLRPTVFQQLTSRISQRDLWQLGDTDQTDDAYPVALRQTWHQQDVEMSRTSHPGGKERSIAPFVSS